MIIRNDWLAEPTAWRRDFHVHPERGYHEHRMAALVAGSLAGFGLEVTTGTSGVDTLRTGSGSRAIASRAGFLRIGQRGHVPFTIRVTTSTTISCQPALLHELLSRSRNPLYQFWPMSLPI